MRRKPTPGQFTLEFRTQEEILEQQHQAKKIAEWLNEPSPPPRPPLPPLPEWIGVVPDTTRCEIVRGHGERDALGKVVVIRKVDHGAHRVWVSDDEPVSNRKNAKGRWVTDWDPMCAQRPMAMEDLKILPEPWVKVAPPRLVEWTRRPSPRTKLGQRLT
jgi:hypothetical protein